MEHSKKTPTAINMKPVLYAVKLWKIKIKIKSEKMKMKMKISG